MYELSYIISPNLTEPDIVAQTDKVRGFINGNGGEIKNEKPEEKKRLAFPIKKHEYGFYVSIMFSLEREKVEELERQIKLEQNILRHLLILKEEKDLIRPKTRIPKSKTIPPVVKSEVLTEKATIEQIDKKLEEILEQ